MVFHGVISLLIFGISLIGITYPLNIVQHLAISLGLSVISLQCSEPQFSLVRFEVRENLNLKNKGDLKPKKNPHLNLNFLKPQI